MEYKLIPKERFDEVIRHLRGNFFADEPLNKAAGLCQRGEGHQLLERHSQKTLSDNLSLMAVNEKDEIAGVMLNGMSCRGDLESAQNKLELSDDERFKSIFRLLFSHGLKANIFGHFNVDKVLDMSILSVDGRFRGHGIAKELVRRSEQLAKDCKFKVMKADATGVFSQKIFKSNGFQVLSEQFYDKYTNETGQPVLKVESPHIKLQLLYKLLD